MSGRLDDFPLHRIVWSGDLSALRSALSSQKHNLDAVDVHNRTPLRLAIALGKLDCAQILVEFGAGINGVDDEGWSAVHDATCFGDEKLLRFVLEERNKAQGAEAQARIPQLLQLLETDGDFYVEMAWDFTSWVPFVSRLCPSDVYRIWKRGGSVRVDTSLLGYHNLRWVRGNRSYLFRCSTNAQSRVDFEMIHLDHDQKVAVVEDILHVNGSQSEPVSAEEIVDRLNAPVAVTLMNSQSIGFARDRAGIWGFQSDRSEVVGSTPAKVFNVSGIDVITRTRYEHLPDRHPARKQAHSFAPLSQAMGAADTDADADEEMHRSGTYASVDEYLHPRGTEAVPAPGRPRQMRQKRQQFKAQVWMAEDFPLSLQRQVLPVVDLMAPTSQHIAKLRDFISLQLPAGFPVKIEIPVYHLVHARVTFGNYSSQVDPSVFEVPADYEMLGSRAVRPPTVAASDPADPDFNYARALQYSMGYQDELEDSDSRLLQHAMALSLGDTSSAESWACDACTFSNSRLADCCEMCTQPRARRPPPSVPPRSLPRSLPLVAGPDEAEDALLQQAIALSLVEHGGRGAAGGTAAAGGDADWQDSEDELQRILERSKFEQ